MDKIFKDVWNCILSKDICPLHLCLFISFKIGKWWGRSVARMMSLIRSIESSKLNFLWPPNCRKGLKRKKLKVWKSTPPWISSSYVWKAFWLNEIFKVDKIRHNPDTLDFWVWYFCPCILNFLKAIKVRIWQIVDFTWYCNYYLFYLVFIYFAHNH